MEKDKLKKNHYHRRNSTSYGKLCKNLKKSFYWIDRKRLFCENCQLNKRNEILFPQHKEYHIMTHIVTRFTCMTYTLKFTVTYYPEFNGQCERWKQQDRIWDEYSLGVEDSQNNNYVDRIINGAIPRDVIDMERVKYVPIIKENDSHKKAKVHYLLDFHIRKRDVEKMDLLNCPGGTLKKRIHF
ncbi:hypothetical protein H8356DRAFT_1349490 [Neocallimastix lanati (nom. inval.)]|nr:hypothetical protein H8356DRAFT_1349490 [Neocallimastix sp. JGI-2020a]